MITMNTMDSQYHDYHEDDGTSIMPTMNTKDDTYHDYHENGEHLPWLPTYPTPKMNLQAWGQGVWDLVLTL